MTTLTNSQHSPFLSARLGELLAASADSVVEDAHGRVVQSRDADATWRCAYDEAGDASSIDGPFGRAAYAYDARRRLVDVRHPDGSHTRYQYGPADELVAVHDRGRSRIIDHDRRGRITRIAHDRQSQWTFGYDNGDRVVEAIAPGVRTSHEYDEAGRVIHIEQTIGASTVHAWLGHDAEGRISEIAVSGGPTVRYSWDCDGRPARVGYDDVDVAALRYDDAERRVTVALANGVVERARANHVDGRPLERVVDLAGDTLLSRQYAYDDLGHVIADGHSCYRYDQHGRLVEASLANGSAWRYGYDKAGNLADVGCPDGRHLRLGHEGELLTTVQEAGSDETPHVVTRDAWGGVTGMTLGKQEWAWRYDAAGQLVQTRRDQVVTVDVTYDHKGRLVELRTAGRTERYLYGAGDELLAVTDAGGEVVRVPVRTPLGVHAEIVRSGSGWETRYLHHDDRGTLWLATGAAGKVMARYDYDPFGLPLTDPADLTFAPLPRFRGRSFVPETGLYAFGARWYHPYLRAFVTADRWTGAPDDERLVHPVFPGCRQRLARAESLDRWLRQPRVLRRYAYCGNDPVGGVDPTGHWSFGGTVLSTLGAIWTLPNTIFGLTVELSCLVGEVVRWLAWAVTLGKVSWETPGFDVASSRRLNAFALVFRGGWLGSFPSLLGVTFGNVFFVYGRWPEHPGYSGPGEILPRAYDGKVRLPKAEALYEHELRHTNQYGWLGPFFHLGLPLFGFYEWDVLLHGYRDAWTEKDARDHSEGPDAADEAGALISRDGVVVDGFDNGWVYWRDGAVTKTLRCGTGGVLTTSPVEASTHATDYIDPFTSAVGTVVELAASTGSRPLPPILLDTPGLFASRAVREGSDGRPTVDLAPASAMLEHPSELTFWTVLWELPTDDYSIAGLPQGPGLWSSPNASGRLTVTEGAAAADPGHARPRERLLTVRGRVQDTATAVRLRIYDIAGEAVALAARTPGDPDIDEVVAILAEPGGGPERGFSATLRLADPVAAFGPVQIVVIAESSAGVTIDAFSVHLCGLQLALVDDPGAAQPGPILGEPDEVVVVDFADSPQASLVDLAAQTRARRMVAYNIANERRPLPNGGQPVLRPRMPLWTGEVQLVGVARGELEDLLRRRSDRSGPPSRPAGPLTTRLSFRWKLTMSWDGPDAASGNFASPFPRPNQRHRYQLIVPAQPATVSAVISYGRSGRLTDSTGVAVPLDPAGTLPGGFDPTPVLRQFPVVNRRAPAVRIGQYRPWGRASGARRLPAVVLEFQPSIETVAGVEAVRGGDGALQISEFAFDGTPVDRGSVVDAGGQVVAVDATSSPAALPPFRVVGQNAPAGDVEDVVRALVREYVDAHAGDAHIRPLTRDCWETTVLKILRHESGGRYWQFDDRGTARRSWARQGVTWTFGTEQSMPLFGPPHGYGIGQLDLFSTPPRGASDDEVWNWVENLRASVLVVLAEKAVSAWALIGQHAPTPTDRFTRAAFQRETVRRYNGGTEFRWTGATWGIQPSLMWADVAHPNLGPHANLLYANAVLGATAVVYYTSAAGAANQADGANTVFAYPPPIPFVVANFTPETGP